MLSTYDSDELSDDDQTTYAHHMAGQSGGDPQEEHVRVSRVVSPLALAGADDDARQRLLASSSARDD